MQCCYVQVPPQPPCSACGVVARSVCWLLGWLPMQLLTLPVYYLPRSWPWLSLTACP
jgi:hypothetical protein